MKTPQAISTFLSALTFCGAFAFVEAADLTQSGQITLDPTSGPVILTLKGAGYNSAASGGYGLTLSYHDYSATNDVATSIFRLYRPVGQYQWQFSTDTGTDRLAMQLDNDHILKLTDPSDSTDPDKTIELRPGAANEADDSDKGIFINGQQTISAKKFAYFSGIQVGRFWLSSGYLAQDNDSVAGINVDDGSAAFANGNAIIDADGNLYVRSISSLMQSSLDEILGFSIRASTSNTTSIDYNNRTLYDINGTTSVIDWGQGDGALSLVNGSVFISNTGYISAYGIGSDEAYLLATRTWRIKDYLQNQLAIDVDARTLYDTNGSLAVMSWGQGNGSTSFSGKVGVGTPAPSEKLDVVGNIRATGIITCAPGGDIPMYSGN